MKQPVVELSELLDQTSEYVYYFGELGVEVVDIPTKPIEQFPNVINSGGAKPLSQSQTLSRDLAPPAPRKTERARSDRTLAGPGSQDALFADLGPAPFTTVETLEDIWRDIGDCQRCGLCEGRTQVVNTHGNPKARLMFIGEAPGADEDAQGRPFVGRAGQLLTKMIEAMGLKREDVIIGNVNRCRPPGNRQPTLEEAAICRPFLFREIAAVQPEVIVVMGNTALRNLLEMREGITRVRGQFQDFRGIKVMPTFHPAYLLRDPSKKRETWEDLKKVRDYLENADSKNR
jgi:uracil-DNA glycosylase family 4